MLNVADNWQYDETSLLRRKKHEGKRGIRTADGKGKGRGGGGGGGG